MATRMPVGDRSDLEQLNENVTPEVEEKLDKLRSRKDPVNVLVVGPAGAGKSELINIVFGKGVSKVLHESGVCPVDEYNGEYKGIKIKVYDTVGFSGSSNCTILSNIARRGKFDLILICTKLGDRADRAMFLELASVLNDEMWKRTVVVLTFANRFITLESVQSEGSEAAIEEKIREYKAFIVANLSHRIKKEILQEIPVCIAGEDKKVKLPTAEDWLKVLWATLVIRASVETYLFLHLFSMYFVLLVFVGSVGVGAAAGAVIGGTVGSIVPVFGTVIGAGVGGIVGGVAGGIYSLGKFFG